VPGDDFREVGEVLRKLCDLLGRLLRDRGALLGALERQAPLLQCEAVDVGVLDRVGLDGLFDREAGLAEAPEDRLADPDARRARAHAALHEADRPAVTVERLAGGDGPPAHRRLPVELERRRLDLTEHDVDHPVDELLLVGNVVVEGHRACSELLGELAHGQRLEAVAIGERHGGLQHAVRAQRGSRLGDWFGLSHVAVRFTPLRARTVYE
jgi:hypothetical protein